ncbi:hypothetical protein A3Q34_10205 [Colwellia sp. PAMC 20917]|uniref:hypothetical protein n=1 Tax=unclassified Colwellia TaxID=196834 RepID=UPI0008789E2D|nr:MULTISPECIES: hypothetical protein [unclassified Colwellia]AOW77192.1 hypothetical protein A3Q34_10205 [Colwellia sp. PAMC 20917]MBA6373516.1 hypothetical protein [Colwellia sp. BRX8-4]MBA6385146.1 hypothetical protein [Colwellia sp. BRX10-9]MBA6395983.1 hypothetical protein [Colwellia sp. BRX10-6]
MFKIIVLLSSLFLASCATVAPIVNSNSPINIYGVTTLPPQNGDWVVITASGYQSSLGSKGVNKNESQVVNVSIFQLPSLDSDKKFLEYIVSSRASAPNTGRFENKENTENLSSLNGAVCVKYHSISQDTNAKIQGGKASMLFESIGYNCQHPKKNTVGVNIEYSSRYFVDTGYSTLQNDSDAFFNNIQFTEF